MGIDDSLACELVRRVLSAASPAKIILFGSAATGEMTSGSDIDLLIVENESSRRHDRALAIRDAIGDIGWPVDVLIMAPERFERTKDVIGGIAYPAHKYGRVLYEAA
ncbi:MAG: nucleotidyltransferase domain-containing protein [Bryobacteraceae bacterium]|nr:nucleotidyltransferase domain-containing protein [Bryobacteraceae bacterium]